MPARLGALVEQLGGTLHGDPGLLIEQVASLDMAGPQQIAFMAGAKYRSALDESRGGAFIVSPADGENLDRPHIRVRNPSLYFARVAQLLNPEPAVRAGIHADASVDATAHVDDSAEVAAGAVIGAGAFIGPGVSIGAGSVIGEACSIGAGTRLHARVTLYPRSVIGERCVLHSGAVIGADGFGFAREAD
ncbi:MAG: LpxD N-terminal domain-containing protein, partial [Methyloversatilis sp.]